ncbi:MAG: xanthine dehydrogenase family protein subunit [Hyphomicrobiales bacterium]|nr:xanthine dehydrogenase family protein subunit [Hyphomicrobiales bacterium]
MASFELVEPTNLQDAFALLDDEDPAVRPFGGGTALMLMMKAQLFKPVRLVSLRLLGQQFDGIALSADKSSFRIGAMTTFSQLEHSAEIATYLPVITKTMRTLANVRVRNVATIGGNLAHGDPHLDLPPVWLALGAKALIINKTGERLIPVEEIFAGYYETTLEQGDLIAELHVPVRPGWRSHYAKVTTRAEHDWPALGIAVSVLSEGGRVKGASLVLSAAVDRPTRLVAAENILRGATLDDAVLRAAGEAAVEEVHIETDNRGSAAYKKHLLRVHLGRAIQTVTGA